MNIYCSKEAGRLIISSSSVLFSKCRVDLFLFPILYDWQRELFVENITYIFANDGIKSPGLLNDGQLGELQMIVGTEAILKLGPILE